MYCKFTLICFFVLGAVFLYCKDLTSPEYAEKIYIVQTIYGMSVDEFAQNIDDYCYSLKIKFTNYPKDYNFEGAVYLVNSGWQEIVNYEEYTGNTNGFYIDVKGKLEGAYFVSFLDLKITTSTINGNFCCTGPTIDTTGYDFTAVISK